MDTQLFDDFPVLESALALELGLTKEAMRDLRKKHLAAGEFALGRRGMCFTHAAANRLRAALGVSEKKAPAEKETPAPSVVSTTVVTLYIKAKPMNKRIVLACADEALMGEVVRVRVRSSENFIKGMEIHALHDTGTLYSLVGRCPRFRGRF